MGRSFTRNNEDLVDQEKALGQSPSSENLLAREYKTSGSNGSRMKPEVNGKNGTVVGGGGSHLKPQQNGKHHHHHRASFNSRIKRDFARLSHDLGIGTSLGLNEGMMILNPGTEDEMEVWGYRSCVWRQCLTLLGVVATFGLLGLPLYWLEHLWLYCTSRRCVLADATSVLVLDHFKGIHTTRFVKKVKIMKQPDLILPVNGDSEYKTVSRYRYFNVKKHKYIWDGQEGAFFKCQGLDRNISIKELHAYGQGLTEEEGRRRAVLYGRNEIKVPVHGIPLLLVKEILTPFYVFQLFSVSFWYADEYWMYATAIVITSAVSLSAALYNTRTTQQNLRDTIVSSESVNVFRPDGTTVMMMSTELVPGDLIEVADHGCQMLCDAVLLEGQAIMNESMLTGESVPITKTSCTKEDAIYTSREHEKHTLKCGTQVIQTRKYKNQKVKAVVIRTGYLTSKGDLVRSILYPPPVDFQFESDSYKFILVLAFIATLGMAYTLAKMVMDGATAKDVVLEVFDLITIVVPPALPAAMTIGVVIAQQRLGKKNIFCISPRTINVAGSTDCVCFDKTGTITEDGMDMWGVIPTRVGLQSTLHAEPRAPVEFGEAVHVVSGLSVESRLLVGMAMCHELSKIEGEIMGDPLDVKIFESTGWTLEQDGEEENQVDRLVMPYVRSPVCADQTVLQAAPQRLLQFSSENQCMSVVCRVFQEQADGFGQPQCIVYCKGSPEKLRRLCLPASIPPDYLSMLDRYASHGYRIIAIGCKFVPVNQARMAKINKMTRAEIESELTFLGLIVLENRLKEASSRVLQELHGANVRPVMVTGDNILTAISVARDCGLIPRGDHVIQVVASIDTNDQPHVEFRHLPQGWTEEGTTGGHCLISKGPESASSRSPYHFAVDGASFELICNNFRADLLPYLVVKGAVFARMRPDMKQQLVEILQDLGYFVAMCGDGANDCGALKAAHAGISLSEAEASVASPFTSKTPDISCVPLLIREGRAALVTSFGIFKYMAAYSVTQFVSVMILYEIYSNLSDSQFLYVDLFIITTLAAVFGLNGAYVGPLAPVPPMNSLISPLPLFSLFSQLLIVIVFQLGALFLIKSQPWFVAFDDANACYANTTAELAFNVSGLINLKKCTRDDDPVASYENYAIFCLSQFQYMILVIAFAKGAPYRQRFYRNIPLIVDLFFIASFSLYLTVHPHEPFIYYPVIGFELFLPPTEHLTFRLYIIGLVAANAVVAILCEVVVADMLIHRLSRRKNKKYNVIEDEMNSKLDWPPLMPTNGPGDGGQPAAAADMLGASTKTDVIITDHDVSDPVEAFDSLFATPPLPGGIADNLQLPRPASSNSHSTAAVFLNPPPMSPRKSLSLLSSRRSSDLPLVRSSADSTPCKKAAIFSTAVSSPSSRFVSCDSVLVENELLPPASSSCAAAASDSSSDGAER